jgi:hypothetical protein
LTLVQQKPKESVIMISRMAESLQI